MDKTEHLLDVLNNPEKYSPEEIEELLQDDEVKEIFDLLDKTKSSLQHVQTPDIDEEWNKFKNNKNIQKRKMSEFSFSAFFSRKIAASVTIIILSITAVGAIVGISVNTWNHNENVTPENELSTTNEITLIQPDSVQTQSVNSNLPLESVIFDNEPLEDIMKQIGDFYGYKIEFENDHGRSLRLYFRWDQASNIKEIVESLNNFEQIHLSIDGETIKID